MLKKDFMLNEIKEFFEELKKEKIEDIIEKFYFKLHFMRTLQIYLENKEDEEELEKLLKKYENIYDVYKKFMSCSEYFINTNGDIEEMLAE